MKHVCELQFNHNYVDILFDIFDNYIPLSIP